MKQKTQKSDSFKNSIWNRIGSTDSVDRCSVSIGERESRDLWLFLTGFTGSKPIFKMMTLWEKLYV